MDARAPVEPYKDYLGDGVYAEFDGYQVWIWTSNGIVNGDKIALEPAVLRALNAFAKRCEEST
jgi:hypothetical protein